MRDAVARVVGEGAGEGGVDELRRGVAGAGLGVVHGRRGVAGGVLRFDQAAGEVVFVTGLRFAEFVQGGGQLALYVVAPAAGVAEGVLGGDQAVLFVVLVGRDVAEGVGHTH